MDEAKLNNLCAHYKDSFDDHRASIRQRDRLFFALLIILAVFTLQLTSENTAANLVNNYMAKAGGLELSADLAFVSTLLWLLLLGFSTRYFQVVNEIERQLAYLHSLEQTLNAEYPETPAFTREGNFYREQYPLFSDWVWLLYTLLFPLLLIVSVLVRMLSQIESMGSSGVNFAIDFACSLIVATSAVLYIYRLHESTILRMLNK